ncbi:hypothetical protein FCM35_KLT19294 [Carex littledalei]|uniref:CCHC-type domain-containing protein n=1 Tax=Carex littledalei TaxID=544730 RepID=A0A833RBP1_9POAL|nr:hypothetical protein FCM35_KLT19294 [Carex littledalei]
MWKYPTVGKMATRRRQEALFQYVVAGQRPISTTVQHLHQIPTQPPAFNETNATGGVQGIEEGWTEVTRRRPRGIHTERRIPPKLNKQIELLKAQGRCFRCLDRGHKKLQCRNSIRCIKCRGYGHTSRKCVAPGAPPINPAHSPSHSHTIPPAHTPPVNTNHENPSASIHQPATSQSVTMDLDNWETLPMLSPNTLPARGPPLKVFFPPNDNMRSPNLLLDRSAVVLLGPGADIVGQLPRRIAAAIGTTFGCHPDAFKISTLEPAAGDLLVEFPSNVLRNMAVDVGVFMIARGIEVQLRPWTPNMHMVRDPMTHRARIRLRNFPMQYWNFHDVNHLISGFGYTICMTPVISNDNFDTLRVLVACYDPTTIPPSVELHKDPRSKVVHIDLEGWLHNLSPSLQTLSEDEGERASSNLGPHRHRHHNRQPGSWPTAPYGRHNEANTRHPQPTGGSGSTTLDLTGEVQLLKRRDPLPQQQPIQPLPPRVSPGNDACIITRTEPINWQISSQTWDRVQLHATNAKGETFNAEFLVPSMRSLCRLSSLILAWERDLSKRVQLNENCTILFPASTHDTRDTRPIFEITNTLPTDLQRQNDKLEGHEAQWLQCIRQPS